jgi:hypothetical protein
VLCGLIPQVQFTPDDAFYEADDGERYDADGELPKPVRRIAKVAGSAMFKLMELNDGEKQSFAEIADWIEANL